MNKTIMLALVLAILASSASAVTLRYTERVYEGAYPSVYLYSQTPDPVQPGNYVELKVKADNKGVDTLKNFQIELIPKYPFSFDKNEIALKEYGNIGSGEYGDSGVVIKWKLRVDANAVEGNNTIQVKYRFGTDQWVYKDLDVSVRTSDAILNIKSISTIPPIVAPGEEFKLVIEAENQADSLIKNVKFKLDVTPPFVTIGSTDEKYVKLLDSGETENVTFDIISKGTADATVYTMPLKLSFYDNEEKQYLKNTSFGIILLEQPQLVKNIESSEVVSSGDKGKVTISISNTGVEEVKFVKVRLEDGAGYKTVSARELYLGNIDSDDFESAVFTIYAKTKEQSIPLNLTMEYKDGLNNAHTEEFALNLPLYSSGEAKKLGLKQPGNFLASYVSFVVIVFAFIFWVYMMFDLIQRKMIRYKKISWLAILVLTTIFGAATYYFMIKRKAQQ
jgi:hypothetical protein